MLDEEEGIPLGEVPGTATVVVSPESAPNAVAALGPDEFPESLVAVLQVGGAAGGVPVEGRLRLAFRTDGVAPVEAGRDLLVDAVPVHPAEFVLHTVAGTEII